MGKNLDLLSLCKLLLKHIKFIVFFTFICAVSLFLVSKILISPKYSSSAMLYVENKQPSTEQLSQNDITVAQTLAETSSIIFTSDTVMEKVAADPLIDYTMEELTNMIVVSSVNNTEVMEISIECYDPDEAAYIVSVMAETCISEYNRVIKSGTITEINTARCKRTPSSPNIPLNTFAGAMIGLIVSCMIALIRERLDTTIKPTDDIAKMYNTPVFAEVVDFDKSTRQKFKYKYDYS